MKEKKERDIKELEERREKEGGGGAGKGRERVGDEKKKGGCDGEIAARVDRGGLADGLGGCCTGGITCRVALNLKA